MKIESKDRSIEEILVSGFFKIPRFQRPYSWTKDNVEEFWQDTIERQGEEYFIGSLVVFGSGDTYGVVDGQQRLTTITMLLCAIRDLAKDLANKSTSSDLAKDLAESTHTLIQKKNLKNKQQFILQTETSYPYFQNQIQSLEKKTEGIVAGEEEKLVEEGFTFLRGKLQDACDTAARKISGERRKIRARVKALEKVREQMLGLNAIFIELDNEDDAYEIFETLNTRGKDLSLTDLVKNHITRNLPEEAAGYDRGKERWNKMVNELDDADIDVDTFLHHFWLSRYEYITAKKLFKSLKKKVGKPEAENFLRDLETDAENYRLVVNPTHEKNKWSKNDTIIRDSLQAIEIFRIRQPVPFLLSVMRAYRKKGMTKAQAENAIALIENYHFAFSAVTSQRSSGGASLRYAKFAKRLFGANKDEISRIIRELTSVLRVKQASPTEFNENFIELRYSEEYTKQKKLVQYVLYKFDRYVNSKNPPVKYEEMTIEHLTHQSSHQAKKTDIARIGNLLLVSEALNQNLGTKPFLDKKKILVKYKATTFLGSTLEGAKKWERDEILQRSKDMADIALKSIWKV